MSQEKDLQEALGAGSPEIQELAPVPAKNPSEYGYKGDELITIPANDFRILKIAAEQAIDSTIIGYLPEVVQYRDMTTSQQVENPSIEDLETGKVIEVTDRLRTFSPSNLHRYFSAERLTPQMIEAQRILTEIHYDNIEKGVAKHLSEL